MPTLIWMRSLSLRNRQNDTRDAALFYLGCFVFVVTFWREYFGRVQRS